MKINKILGIIFGFLAIISFVNFTEGNKCTSLSFVFTILFFVLSAVYLTEREQIKINEGNRKFAKDFKAPKEEGVWVVYDLEANRKIQELLTKEKFIFKFVPNLEVIKNKPKKEGVWERLSRW